MRAILCNVIAIALLTATPGLYAHYINLDRELSKQGTLTVGISATGQPFSQQQDGELRGFEVAMAKAVADAHDLSLRLVRLPRGELAAALARGEVDAINTLALEGDVADSRTLPFLVVGDHVMILRGNPFRIRQLEDLQGRTVSATSGSTAERFALSLNDQFKESGGTPMQVHSFPFHRATHFPVSMGHAAAYFVNTLSAVAVSRDADARTTMLEGAFRPVREVGFTVRAGDENIYHAVEHAIAAMVATGKYRRLLEEYKLPPELSPFR